MPIITGGKIIEGSRPWYRNNAATGGFGGMGPYTSAAAPIAGALNGIAEPGAIIIALATGVAYQNTGTKAATTWAAVGSVI